MTGCMYAFLTTDDMISEEFDTLEEASNIYKTYSKIIRFGLCKFHIKRYINGETSKRVWVCAKQGYINLVWLDNSNRQCEPKAISREWCKASYGAVRNCVISKWNITKSISEHSHPLLLRHKTQCL